MNINSLRARVRSLRRRMALPYAHLMVQRMADEPLHPMGLRPSG